MTNDTNNEFLDIDKLLQSDNSDDPTVMRLRPDQMVKSDNVCQPEEGRLQRLHHRISHISTNLRQAISNAVDHQEILDDDRHASGQLVAEMHHWENALSQLERTIHDLSSRRKNATQSESKPTGPQNMDQQPDQQNELIKALAEQEARIRELEKQLKTLGVNTPAGDQVDQFGEPRVVTNETLASDPYANRLLVAVQDGKNLKFSLTQNIITIGREPGNDIQIRSRFISRFHARIVSDQDGAAIEDLDSRNGVVVNAQRVSRKQLRSGDLISVGRVQLQYIDIVEDTGGEGRA